MRTDDLVPPFELLDGHFKKKLTDQQEWQLMKWVDASPDNRMIFNHHRTINAIKARYGAKVVSINSRSREMTVERIIEIAKIDERMQKLGYKFNTVIEEGYTFFTHNHQKFVLIRLPKVKGIISKIITYATAKSKRVQQKSDQ